MKNKYIYIALSFFGIYSFLLFQYLSPFGELSLVINISIGFIVFVTYAGIFFLFNSKLEVIHFDGSKVMILLQVLSVSFLSTVILIFLFLSLLDIIVLDIDSFSNIFIDMTLVSILPTLVAMYFYEKRLLRIRYESINFQQTNDDAQPNEIKVSSEGQKKALNLNLDSLLLIEGADNYCNIYFLQDGVVKKELFRSTLKNMNSQLQEVDFIYRCHRSYIINSKNVKGVSGKSQAYRIEFEGVDIKVPVSRSFDISVLD